jgi:hypothetical protein
LRENKLELLRILHEKMDIAGAASEVE